MPLGQDSYEPYQSQAEWQQSPPPSSGIQQRHGPLSMEQVNWLLTRLSNEDQSELMKLSKKCLYNLTLTMSLPLTLGVTGGLYYARSYLNLAKKGVPFYTSVGAVTLFVSNFFLARRCGEALKPRLAEFYDKYQLTAPNSDAVSYDAIRQAHRSVGLSQQQPTSAEGAFNESYSSERDRRLGFWTTAGEEEETTARPSSPRPVDFSANEPTLMSGTPYYPVGDSSSQMGGQAESGTNYGGIDFS